MILSIFCFDTIAIVFDTVAEMKGFIWLMTMSLTHIYVGHSISLFGYFNTRSSLCSADGTCTHRHDNQKNVVHNAVTDAQFVSRREVPNILPDEDSKKKKVDIIIDNFNCLGVGPLAIDVVV